MGPECRERYHAQPRTIQVAGACTRIPIGGTVYSDERAHAFGEGGGRRGEKIRRRAIVEMKGAGTLVQDAQAERGGRRHGEEGPGRGRQRQGQGGGRAVLVALTTNNFKRTL